MNVRSSPQLPSSFDPAIHLHSECPEDNHLRATTFSDDINGLNAILEESTARKNREGIVIQHRRWRTLEVFRSEDENFVDTPVKQNASNAFPPLIESQESAALPSSPPTQTMARPSSPLTYPASSSPNQSPSPRKRRKLGSPRSPLKRIDGNVRIGGFLEEDSEEELTHNLSLAHKKPNASNVETYHVASIPFNEDTNIEQSVDLEKATDSAYASDGPIEISEEPTLSQLDSLPSSIPRVLRVHTCSGRSVYVGERRQTAPVSYEFLIAARSTTVEGHATKSYYGINIHQLMDETAREETIAAATVKSTAFVAPSVEQPMVSGKKGRTLMWTEKYRAKKFTDLVGDERTHRSVLRWLKNWDPIVFPESSRPKPKRDKNGEFLEERVHRKILLLTGPPGLGKTTLAHVCAKQAGYEVQEINASDERSRDVVRGRIRDMVGTENVRGSDTKTEDGKVRKAGRPVAVVVDEVDGVVGGAGGGGEGGFVKALIDLVALDQRNSNTTNSDTVPKKKKKGDKFRILRPLILICNDVYHPSLRPLRQSSIAEIIHIRKPPLNMVVSRMHSIFEKEGVPSDSDGVRRLCEATWGLSSRKEGPSGQGTGEGDIRSVMVVAEWVAAKLRATTLSNQIQCQRLTRKWIEEHILSDLAHGGGAARSIGRGGAKEVVERVFKEGAGFPKVAKVTAAPSYLAAGESTGVIGVAEASKRRAMERLREMIDTSGDTERIMTDCFTTYATQPIQDDTFLSKPNAAYAWLQFHDALNSQVIGSQDWELSPYLSSPILAFHHLFATSARQSYQPESKWNKDNDDDNEVKIPFSGPSAPWTAMETQKANTAAITALQNALSLPLARMYRSPAEIATELLPYLVRMLSPDVKPVVINSSTGNSSTGAKTFATASVRKASEKALVARAAECMAATGVRFEKTRVEHDGKSSNGGFIYRMEPSLDSMSAFETLAGGDGASSTRYAVRQVLEMEWKKASVLRGEDARKRRMGGNPEDYEEEELISAKSKKEPGKALDMRVKGVKRDFFGRVVKTVVPLVGEEADAANAAKKKGNKAGRSAGAEEGRVWVSFNEGFSNAVRKPITLKELMDGL
ncbi:P-loop containing nucleoside triphosphate hydrolase protein [Tothia fuscella]|uniref:P-loop containing nucleoside triphosphate hydrolase protein n=1 Tax=Tothia fuscella TaxID=1048955 RepID=A0A9P4NM66_9PEZI|nr:P-loop containing nucleoside triphosphate hydrolase protein [Tothia fuscella]